MAPQNLTKSQRAKLEELVHRTRDAKEMARGQALLWSDQGVPVTKIADLLGVTRQTVYNWRNQFFGRPGRDLAERLRDAPRAGRPRSGDGALESLLEEVIEEDPQDYGYRATTWTAPLLRKYLDEQCRVEASAKTVNRALRRVRIRWKRPRHRLADRPDTWRQAKGGSNAA